MTRTFTASSYDHVGMVLKFDTYPDDVFILESTSNLGVHLTRFSFQMRSYGTFYKKMMYRKLDFDYSEETLSKLESFLKQAIGKKYKFSISKLTSNKTMTSDEIKRFSEEQETKCDSDDIEEEDRFFMDNRTFFCSELVAKCYKVMGIIDMDEITSKFLPKHFS